MCLTATVESSTGEIQWALLYIGARARWSAMLLCVSAGSAGCIKQCNNGQTWHDVPVLKQKKLGASIALQLQVTGSMGMLGLGWAQMEKTIVNGYNASRTLQMNAFNPVRL